MNDISYTLSQPLMQAIVGLLGSMPAHQSRGVLNAIEHECTQQDKAREDQAKADLRKQLAAEIAGTTSDKAA
jgi:hypothetical protein